MPLYLCRAEPGVIPEGAREAIAVEILRIHCEVTGAPPTFVHTFFMEETPRGSTPGERAVALLGSIRAGRTDEQKTSMIEGMQDAIRACVAGPLGTVSGTLVETPASWIMEGGDVMPEPGEEAAWLEAHEAKLRAAEAG